MTLNEVYDTALTVYALGLLFVFTDCLRRSPGLQRAGAGLLVVTAVFQLTGLGYRWKENGGLPIYTPYDFLFGFSTVIVFVSLALAWRRRSEFTVLLLSVAGYSAFLLNRVWLTAEDHTLQSWSAVHGWLAVHIILANLSFAALTLGAVFALMYLFLHARLKKKRWDDRVRRLPSLELLDRYTYGSVLAGTPLLAVSLLAAGFSIVSEGRLPLLRDLKVWTTLIGFGVFAAYLPVKRRGRIGGVAMARWAAAGYGFIILNFLLNSWSNFHQWGGE
ncbi:cytochrome c biogenesis protein CcsA [Paenibacillus spiritus]|uniref:cytochrome c biogenesis protein CcsA n=1 Tax=Paenibacillus spiritus TaxID=2496557 RepID=UPI001CC36DD1|nr:cytochrome c biogenesis protein CcsA [Paenibacillus spiritus]